MRAVTAQQERILEGSNRSTHLRIKVDPGSGFQDFTNLRGHDFVVGATYGNSTDNPVGTAQIALRRQANKISLATLMDSSPLNQVKAILDLNYPVTIETAVLAQDASPTESDFVEKFRGVIDKVGWGRDPLALLCSDQGSLLVKTFIERQRIYGSAFPGTAVETVIQQILDDNINTPGLGSVTLFSVNGTGGTPFNPADSPGFKISVYRQSKESVLAAIRRLAQLFGFDVKYKFQTNTAAFQLVLFNPDRQFPARGTLALTGQPSDGQTFDINATTVTARAAAPGVDEFLISATVAGTVSNIVNALNAGSESANIFAFAEFAASNVVIEWATAGTVGNSIVFTEALSNATADGAGTLGGTQTGSDGKTVPDFTFNQDRYFDIPRLDLAIENIRNVVEVTFGDPQDNNNRVTVERKDQASIDKFNRLFMGITESSNSQIDTVEEAADFANFALRDLSEPEVNQSVNVPYFWPIEESDLYRFKANDQHYDTDQDLAVVSYTHTLTRDSAKTLILTRGKPAGGVQRWLDIEGNNIRNPASDLATDNAPEGVTTESGVGFVIVNYDAPRGMSPPIPDWVTTKVFALNENEAGFPDFTPTVATLVMEGRLTRFDIGGLIPGDDYAVKLQIIDGKGNVGATSTFIIQAAERVGPFHENNDAQVDQLLRNPDLNIFTQDSATNPPDFWTVLSPHSWGAANEVFFDQINAQTGDKAVSFDVDLGQLPAIETEFIPLRDGELVSSHVLAQLFAGAAINTTVSIRLRYFDRLKAFISEDISLSLILPSPGGFELANGSTRVAPVGTRFVKVRATTLVTAAGGPQTVLIDRIGLARSFVEFRGRAAAGALVAGVEQTVPWSSLVPIGASLAAGEITVDFPGIFVGNVFIGITSPGGNPAHLAIVTTEVDDGSGSFVRLTQSILTSENSSGAHISHHTLAVPAVEVGSGGIFRIRAECDVAATYGAAAGAPAQEFVGQQLTRND